MPEKIVVSALPKTWILDLDGTVVKHNGYKLDGHDTLLPGAKEFLTGIPKEDMIIFITSRTGDVRTITVNFLRENDIRFDHIIFGVPYGERILVNDRKPSGLEVAVAVNPTRDVFMDTIFEVDKSL